MDANGSPSEFMAVHASLWDPLQSMAATHGNPWRSIALRPCQPMAVNVVHGAQQRYMAVHGGLLFKKQCFVISND